MDAFKKYDGVKLKMWFVLAVSNVNVFREGCNRDSILSPVECGGDLCALSEKEQEVIIRLKIFDAS